MGTSSARAGGRLAFALMLNNYRPAPGASAGEADLDALAALLAEDL